MKRFAPQAVVLALGLAAIGASAWRAAGVRAGRTMPVAEADRRAAVGVVSLYLQLRAHLQGSNGDRRFAERLPAGDDVVDEAMRDVAFVTHSRRVEEPRLLGREIRNVRAVRSEQYEVETKEYWVTRIISAEGAVLDTRSDVVRAKYLVATEAPGGRVVAWDLMPRGDQ